MLHHVFTVLDGGDDRRVGRGTSYASLLQLFHQRGLVVARGRLRKALPALQIVQFQSINVIQAGQFVGRFVVVLFLFFGDLVYLQESVEAHN